MGGRPPRPRTHPHAPGRPPPCEAARRAFGGPPRFGYPGALPAANEPIAEADVAEGPRWLARLRRLFAPRRSGAGAGARPDGALAPAEWEAAIDGVAEAVLVTDRGGRIVRANRAFARLAGARAHELRGRALSEVLAGHPERWWTSAGDGIVAIEDPVFDTLFEVSSARVGDHLVRVARDVGEARRLHEQLVHAEKLAGLGALASGAAHEMNGPTTVVAANLGELRRYVAAYEGALAELSALALSAGEAERAHAVASAREVALARREAANAVAESQEAVERIRLLAASLRSLARRDPAGEPPAPVDLADVAGTVVRAARADLAGARVDLRGPAVVLGRRGELVDLVLNLVLNAAQAGEEGRPNRVAVEVLVEGGAAVLRVSDTGRGIPPAHMRRLFEPFFTTKGPGAGSGLGLSLARKIVLAHGGSIDVASEVGAGSTFTVRLPAADAARASGDAASA